MTTGSPIGGIPLGVRTAVFCAALFAHATGVMGQEEVAHSSPSELAMRALAEAQDAGEQLAPEVRMDLLYLVAAEEEPWVDSLQVAVDELLEESRVGAADSTIASGYLGALEVLRAKYGTWPPSRIKWVRRGVGRLDTLVSEDPSNPHLLFLRTASTLFLPSIMGREDQARADMESLATSLTQSDVQLAPALRSRMVGFVLEYGDWLDPELKASMSVGEAPRAPAGGGG